MTTTHGRIAYWDNAKWLAMVLVVVGHAVQPMGLVDHTAMVVYVLIYAFHMPLFGVISGYFTAAEPSVKHYARVISDLLVPYVLFETIWTVLHWIIGSSRALDYSTSSWTLWFLLALAFFRIALPVIARLKWPLLWTVVLAVAIGYWDGVDQTFSIARAVGMLPFFTLGWQLRQWGVMDRWFALPTRGTIAWRAGAVGIFAIAITILVVWDETWQQIKVRRWFFMDRGYAELYDGEQWYDGGIRLLVMLITTILIAAALVLIPRRRTWFTAFGAATMYIYLLHTFILWQPRDSGWIASFADHWWSVPVAVLVGIAITILLSLPIVRTCTKWLVEPRTAWLLRQTDTPPSAHADRSVAAGVQRD